MQKLLISVTVLWFSTLSAAAGEAAATACAEKLTPEGLMMYDATAPHYTGSEDIETLLRAHVPMLVISGKMSKATAMANGRAVGECIYKLQHGE